jgi:hypothetical protein
MPLHWRSAAVYVPPPAECMQVACSYLHPKDFVRAQRALGKRHGVSWQAWMDAVRETPPEAMTVEKFHWCEAVAQEERDERGTADAYPLVAFIQGCPLFIQYCLADLELDFPRHVVWRIPSFDEKGVIHAIHLCDDPCLSVDVSRLLSGATDYCIQRRMHRALAATLQFNRCWSAFAGNLKYAIRELNVAAADMIWASRGHRNRVVSELQQERHWYSSEVLLGFPHYQNKESTLAMLVWLRQHDLHALKFDKQWNDRQMWLYLESLTASTHAMALRPRKRRRA